MTQEEKNKAFGRAIREIEKEVYGASEEVQQKIARDYIKTFGDMKGVFSVDSRKMFVQMAAALKIGVSVYDIVGMDYTPELRRTVMF